MSFTIRHDTPLVAAALAAGVGTEQGRALVERAIFEREQEIEARLRSQAFQRPGESAGTPARLGYGPERPERMFGSQRPDAPESPSVGYQFSDAPEPREYQQQPASAGLTPYQQGSLDLRGRGLDDRAAYDNQRLEMERQRAGQIDQYRDARLEDYDADRARLENQYGPRGTRRSSSRGGSGSTGLSLAQTLPGANVAQTLAPAFGGDVSALDGGDGLKSAEKMLDDLADLPNQIPSLRQLASKIKDLADNGVPPQALEPARAALQQRMTAVRDVTTKAMAAIQSGTGNGMSPGLAYETASRVYTNAAQALGMTVEELADAIKFLRETGQLAPVRAPQRLADYPTPGRPGVTTASPRRPVLAGR